MLVKTEARILIFPGTDFHFPSTSVPPCTFLRLWCELGINCGISGTFCSTDTAYSNVHFLRPNVFRRRKLDLRTATTLLNPALDTVCWRPNEMND